LLETTRIGAAHQVVVGDIAVGTGYFRERAALRPFELDRRHRQE